MQRDEVDLTEGAGQDGRRPGFFLSLIAAIVEPVLTLVALALKAFD